jgi:hypothetical protein
MSPNTHVVSFTPALAPFIQIKAPEDNVGASSSMTLWLNVN